MNKIDDYLARCIPVIVKVQNGDSGRWHWLVVKKKDGTDYVINDPASSKRKSLSEYGNDIYSIRVFENYKGVCSE